MLHRRTFRKTLAALLMGLPLLLAAPRAGTQEGGPFAHLASAIYEMREAKAELKEERFKRHREQAVKDLDAAIEETERALKDAKIEFRRYVGPKNPKEYYRGYKDYPHLDSAVIELREAKKEIEREKRGDFVRAVKAIDVAIARVDEAKGISDCSGILPSPQPLSPKGRGASMPLTPTPLHLWERGSWHRL